MFDIDSSDVLSNVFHEIEEFITETEMELKNSLEKYSKNERRAQLKNQLDNLLEDLNELTKDGLFDIDARRQLLDFLRELSNRHSDSNKETNDYPSINTQLLESELSVLKDQIEAQQDKIKEYEVKISELQAQVMITENSYQEILKQKFNVEDEKNSLINELSRIKTINDDKIRLLESEISFFKKTLLERETEIASLRLYLAKLVRASNHLITDNELDSIPPLSRSSDSLSKKNANEKRIISYKPPIVPRNFNAQPQFKDSNLTGSFTMGSSSTPVTLLSKFNQNNSTNTQNQFLIKSSTPVLNERCLSPVNRLDLATSKEQLEQLEEFCKQRDALSSSHHYVGDKKQQQQHYQNNITSPLSSNHQFNYSSPMNNQFNYLNQFNNHSPSSTCSTPNRSATKSSSSTSQNNSLSKSNNKSGNYLLDKLLSSNSHSFQFKPSMVSKSNDQIDAAFNDQMNCLNDNVSLASSADQHNTQTGQHTSNYNGLALLNYLNRNDSSNFCPNYLNSSSRSNFVSNSSNATNGNNNSNQSVATNQQQNISNFMLQPSQTNSFTSLSLSSNSSSVFGGSLFSDIGLRRPVSFSFGSSNNSSNFSNRASRNPFTFWLNRRASRSSSVPELADDSKLAYISFAKNSNPDLARHAIRKDYDFIVGNGKEKTKSGFKWFFDKMKNKNHQLSQNDLSFSRTSLRATVGPQIRRQRLDVNQEFNQWNSSILAEWFAIIGLGNYSEAVLYSGLNGKQLADVSDVHLEKLLQLKNHFHRKKLRLAIQTVNRTADELTMSASKLDYLWVAKWLDDIGLPQYKELFLENRIDGAVLHNLTIQDLSRLKINTLLHHASIKAGILVLRMNAFDQNCLIRRASPNNPAAKQNDAHNGQINQMSSLESSSHVYDPAEVSLWTSFRAMEWLKSIDLAEYVANLRGSGVHGGLIVFEDAFNSNVLATLLSISVNKTLLRRHLSTYFIQLIGYEIGQRKRNYQDRFGSTQILTKIKLSKKSNFRNSFRKKKPETPTEEQLICPLLRALENRGSPQSTNNLNGQNDSINLKNSKDASMASSLLKTRVEQMSTKNGQYESNGLENLDSLTHEINNFEQEMPISKASTNSSSDKKIENGS